MTSHKDMERAKEVCATLADWNVEVTPDRYFKITQDGVDRIASLIAQVRNETLDAVEAKLAELEKFYANRKGVKTEAEVGRIIGVQDAMLEIRNLKQEDKE